MPSSCFICGEPRMLRSYTKEDIEQLHFFKTPTHKREKWQMLLKKNNLLDTSLFCSTHFEPKFINIFERNGQVIWKLTKDAEPTLMLEPSNAQSGVVHQQQIASTTNTSTAKSNRKFNNN